MGRRRSVAIPETKRRGMTALHGPEDWAHIDVIGEGHVVS